MADYSSAEVLFFWWGCLQTIPPSLPEEILIQNNCSFQIFLKTILLMINLSTGVNPNSLQQVDQHVIMNGILYISSAGVLR